MSFAYITFTNGPYNGSFRQVEAETDGIAYLKQFPATVSLVTRRDSDGGVRSVYDMNFDTSSFSFAEGQTYTITFCEASRREHNYCNNNNNNNNNSNSSNNASSRKAPEDRIDPDFLRLTMEFDQAKGRGYRGSFDDFQSAKSAELAAKLAEEDN